MKVKHTKLKKSIFLILICISLTTIFVVSASAAWYDSGYTYSFYVDDELVSTSPIYFDSNDPGGFHYYIVFFPSEFEGFSSGYYFINYYDFSQSNFVNSIFLGSSFDISNLSVFDSNSDPVDVIHWGDQDIEGVLIYVYAFFCRSDITFNYSFPSSFTPSFTDTVGSGLTSSLSWVGQVVESLTTGPIRPLLECFAVTISVSALLLGIYSIRRFIWGS